MLLDVMSLRNRSVYEYRHYVESFVRVLGPIINKFVRWQLLAEEPSPDAALQFNSAIRSSPFAASLCYPFFTTTSCSLTLSLAHAPCHSEEVVGLLSHQHLSADEESKAQRENHPLTLNSDRRSRVPIASRMHDTVGISMKSDLSKGSE